MSVEITEIKTGFKGFFSLMVYKVRHKMFNGSWTDIATREVFERGHSVGVLLHDPKARTVLLTEQFRLPAYLAGRAAWQYDLVAGKIDAGETTEEVARREAMEESGCAITDLEHITTFMPSVGACTETATLYIANTDLSGVQGIYGLHDENEDIRVTVEDVETAFHMVSTGVIENSLAIIALQWLQLAYSVEDSVMLERKFK